MGLRFRAVDTTFYVLFTSSAEHLVVGAGLLTELMEAGNDREAVAARMHDAEHACDEVTHEIVRRTTERFVTPFEREDIYDLASQLDDVMDHMDKAVDLVLLHELHELPAEVAQQVEVLRRAAELTAESMPRLESPQELGEYCIEINRLENLGDQAYRGLVATLFGGTYDALAALRLKTVVDCLEAAVDAFEQVAITIERITVKS